jgi:hypothetical protein
MTGSRASSPANERARAEQCRHRLGFTRKRTLANDAGEGARGPNKAEL